MKFKTPSKPVVKVAYYADNKRPVQSQEITSYSLDLSKERISIIQKLSIQFNENQAYSHSCLYENQAHSDPYNMAGMMPTGHTKACGPLEEWRIQNSSITKQTYQRRP